MSERIYLYDSTLRDGAQTQGVDFNVKDKQDITLILDDFGIDYVEGGWPGANPTDDEFFAKLPKVNKAKLVAFGMTRKTSTSAENDPGLNAVLNSGVKAVCLVGKTWDFHVEHALGTTPKENVAMISESVAYAKKKGKEVIFDAEHFFDGYKANPEYALSCAKAAYDAGARWVVLCDTNGGTLPHEVEEIVLKVVKKIPGDHLGIHCHNDTENAVANSLAAVRAGVRQVQGTIDGYGERCGNANLISIIPTLMLKMGYKTGVSTEQLKSLTQIARSLDERLNRQHYRHAAYVGSSAFAHKGGLHVSAVAKNAQSYEHINPDLIGNKRSLLVSDQGGKAGTISRLKEMGIKFDPKDPETSEKISALTNEIKEREKQGLLFDSSTDASFEVLARRMLGQIPDYFELQSFRVIDERRRNAKGQLVTLSEATTKVKVGKKTIMTVAEGNGPVNALDKALRKALARKYKQIKDLKLIDYKVRILTSADGTEAATRVLIESTDNSGKKWSTIGISTNVIDASYNALFDSITYKLFHSK